MMSPAAAISESNVMKQINPNRVCDPDLLCKTDDTELFKEYLSILKCKQGPCRVIGRSSSSAMLLRMVLVKILSPTPSSAVTNYHDCHRLGSDSDFASVRCG